MDSATDSKCDKLTSPLEWRDELKSNNNLLSIQDVEALESSLINANKALEDFRRLLEKIKPFLDKNPRFTRRISQGKWFKG